MEDYPVKILMVDDKKENLLSLQVILADRGYQFVEATSGKDALRILLKNQDFALILMDVQMPVMDGFKTAELIRQSEKLKHVPIIFLTADTDSADYIFKAYQSGAVDYMTKPLSAEILQAKVMVFAELHKKNMALQLKEEEANALNEAITTANEDLERQYLEIEKHAAELKARNSDLDAFAYIASHDLQEPLRKIQTFTNLILNTDYENLSPQGKVRFERILYSTNRMRDLINDLLVFSKTNTTDRKYKMTDLNEIVNQVRNSLEENITEKNALIITDMHGSAKIIPFLFVQLLENLFNNSLKFCRTDITPKIELKSRIIKGSDALDVSLLPDQNYCHISIQDNGIGFDQEHKDKIFGVFQRLHGREIYDGTGIGLAIVKRIVENHNGCISASGSPMNGALFNIYIPH
jgi:signal transduction histidine kinase